MALINYPTPEQLAEISDRFIQHHLDIEKIIESVNSDVALLFPPFTGIYQEEEYCKEIISHLQKSSDTLYIFSNMIQKTLDTICIPDEYIDPNPFK